MDETVMGLLIYLAKKMAKDFANHTIHLPDDWTQSDLVSYLSLVDSTFELGREPDYHRFTTNAHILFDAFNEHLGDPTTVVTFNFEVSAPE